MQRLGPSRLRLRTIDTKLRRALTDGPLWSYAPRSITGVPSTLGDLVAQHWNAAGPGSPGAAAALATGAHSALLFEPALDDVDPFVGEIMAVAALEAAGGAASTSPFTTVVVDGRCLQHPDFAKRGIGRYAASVLSAIARTAPHLDLVVVTDPALPAIDAATLADSVRITGDRPGAPMLDSSILLDPAPMTHPPSSLDDAFPPHRSRRIAIVHDFIPAHAPNIYLPTDPDRLRYLARLRRLESFDVVWCNSEAVASECADHLDLTHTTVTPLPLPDRLAPRPTIAIAGLPERFVFAPLGADRRKNLPGAVAVLGALDTLGWDGDLVILSHMPDPHRLELNVFAESIGLDPARFHAVSALHDGEVAWLYSNAVAAVVPSFDEGLSLPVIEAVDAGCPVVASDIAPHRQLLGDHERLWDPYRASDFARAVLDIVIDPGPTLERQSAAIATARARRSFDDVLRSLSPPLDA